MNRFAAFLATAVVAVTAIGCGPRTDVKVAPSAVSASFVERTFSVPSDAGILPTRPEQLATFGELEFNPKKPRVTTLPNGIRLFVLEDHELPLVSVDVLIRTGKMYQKKFAAGGLTGAAMRLGGSESVPGDVLEDSLGFMAAEMRIAMGVDNCNASLDVTKTNFDAAFGLFADVLLNPGFPEAKLAEIRTQAIGAIKRRKDNPREIGRLKFRQVVYGDQNPWSKLTDVDDIRAVTRDDLVEFHKSTFRPNAAYVAIAGDITYDEAVAKVTALLGSWEKKPAPEVVNATLNTGLEPGVYLYPKKVGQSVIRMGATGMKRHSPDEYAVEVMNRIFGNGTFTSRLGVEVRSNRGLAYYVFGAVFEDPDPRQGMLLALAGVRADKTYEAVTVMRDIIAKMSTQEITDGEFSTAKDMIINSFIFNYTSPGQIVSQQSFLSFTGYPDDYLETYIARIRAVTKADVLRVAKKYLDPAQLRIMVVGDPEIVKKPLSELGEVKELETFEKMVGLQIR
jgi:zinc protease